MTTALQPGKLLYQPELWGTEETFQYEMRSALIKADLTIKFRKETSRRNAALISADLEARLPFRKVHQFQIQSRVFSHKTDRVGFESFEEVDLKRNIRKVWVPEEGGERLHHEILHADETLKSERLSVPAVPTVLNALLLPIVLRGAPFTHGIPVFSSIVASRRFYALRFVSEAGRTNQEIRIKIATLPLETPHASAPGFRGPSAMEEADFSGDKARTGELLWEPSSGVAISLSVHVPLFGSLGVLLKKHSRT